MAYNAFFRKISEIEEKVGPLSPLQKILLTTDGSVTGLLEAISGHEVAVRTRFQEVVSADSECSMSLDVAPGQAVNHRVVELQDSETGDVLIYAVSDTPLARLRSEWQNDLMRADIPIGKILKKYEIEGRRELLDVRMTKPDPALSRVFGIGGDDRLLRRKYQIIHDEAPLIHIEEIFPLSSFSGESGVIVKAPSRLHIGLIDLNGGLSRVDGGIGVALDHPDTLLEARRSPVLSVKGGDPDAIRRVEDVSRALLSRLGVQGGASITIYRSPPPHIGLGSGTALALAAIRALCDLYGMSVPVREMALMAGRGGTSGIGTGAFSGGGFLVDGGHSFGENGEKKDFLPSSFSQGTRPPPVVVRHPFPEDWQILLATPHLPETMFGRREKDVFRKFCPIPAQEVQQICHQLVMRILPGIADHDLDLFGAGINHLQDVGFKRVEISLQPPLIFGLLAALREAGAACAGLSSFGPTVYAIADTGLGEIERSAREALGETEVAITRTRADNDGAMVRAA
ncbi:MAG: beta-ribofuranosylaminobenzene 5'-phosphate synthase [Methanoculleus sp. SDB]|nr:MAG: beta-ribofuranosylaminobenzene 5'-phosphate synthase [Methanoculleus sp. SDB]